MSSAHPHGVFQNGFDLVDDRGTVVASARRTGLVDLIDAEADRCDAARAALGITPVS